jgi:hypothetical protein
MHEELTCRALVRLLGRMHRLKRNEHDAGWQSLRREMQLHLYIVLVNTMTGEQIIPQSEREVFERLGMSYANRQSARVGR